MFTFTLHIGHKGKKVKLEKGEKLRKVSSQKGCDQELTHCSSKDWLYKDETLLRF